jgi:hypothetical protein
MKLVFDRTAGQYAESGQCRNSELVSNLLLNSYTVEMYVGNCNIMETDRLKPSGHYMYRTVVSIRTAQWSLYVPHSGHYMYRTMATICTAQWLLYVTPSGHYMYRPVVTIYTVQWSLYVPPSGHYMYRTVVTICAAQWSLYVPQTGHYK